MQKSLKLLNSPWASIDTNVIWRFGLTGKLHLYVANRHFQSLECVKEKVNRKYRSTIYVECIFVEFATLLVKLELVDTQNEYGSYDIRSVKQLFEEFLMELLLETEIFELTGRGAYKYEIPMDMSWRNFSKFPFFSLNDYYFLEILIYVNIILKYEFIRKKIISHYETEWAIFDQTLP